MKQSTFYFTFHIICLISTAGLVFRCLHQYHKDDDTTQLEYRKFHDDDKSIYPSISICFRTYSLIDENKIEQMIQSEPEGSNNRYHRYLRTMHEQVVKKCRIPPQRFMANFFELIGYKQVTKNIMRHLMNLEINLKNNGMLIWSNYGSNF